MVLFFFFKQKTAYEMRISDWSSDVCSSDLGRDLQDVDMFRRRGALRRLVYVGQHRTAEALPDLRQDLQTRRHPDAAPGGDAGPVRLVERGLVDQRNPGPAADRHQDLRNLERVIAALDRARPGQQDERAIDRLNSSH